MTRSRLLLASAAAATLALPGCTVGPNYVAPQLPTPPAFVSPQAAPPPGQAIDPAQWWSAFGDPILDRLVTRALANGPDIRTATSRVREARYQEIVAGAVNKPTVSGLAGYSRLSFSNNVGFGGGASGASAGGSSAGGASGSSGSSGGALSGSSIGVFSLGFDASWELDLFGGGRRQREEAREQTEAAVWNRRDAAVTLAAEVANGYFMLRSDQSQQAIINDELVRQRRALEIAGNQALVGLTPQVDVVRQRAAITSTEARIEPLRADEQVRIHAIAILLGAAPGDLTGELSAPATELGAAPAIPAGLPSDLLRRRADVRAAERQLAAATADIGVATAQLYPSLSLTGLATLASSGLSNLISSNSLQTVGLGNAMFPVIDWGRRRATVGLRREEREQRYISYQQTVLGALRDVEDSLAQLDTERRRNATLRRAVVDAEETARSVEGQYRTGLTAQDPLLNAEANVLSAREQVVGSDSQLRQMTASLFKAIGGGWETLPDVPGADKRPSQPLR
ncbi:efflux transporter outer membrane subunit [uncultured Sphingomonas sp.]|uniref:efflux transporter outer membrane subunit n=1 Tax=uncultured Sphingomonas sp. TaxID=158754 RepID=UPI0035CA0B82